MILWRPIVLTAALAPVFLWVFVPAYVELLTPGSSIPLRGELPEPERPGDVERTQDNTASPMKKPVSFPKIAPSRERSVPQEKITGNPPMRNQQTSQETKKEMGTRHVRKETWTAKQLMEILDGLPSAYVLDEKSYKDGITFRVRQIGRWRDRFLIKCAVANESSEEFFVSLIAVRADNKTVPGQLSMPFSCRFGEEIEGVLMTAGREVEGKPVALELLESGGKHRKIEIKRVRYPF